MSIETHIFTKEHIEATLRLSTEENWNHIEEDWNRILDLNPDTCVGGFVDDELVATCTLSRYDEMGWVGTFLVDQRHRRKGYGSVMFKALIDRAEELGCEWFGLDSTDAGRPIYARNGFVEDENNERWTGPNADTGTEGTEPLDDSHWESLLVLDKSSTNVDRSRQLRHLASEPGAAVRVATDGSQVTGFGFSRPGRLAGSIGPVVASSLDNAKAVINALRTDRHALDGERGIAIDILNVEGFKPFMTEQSFSKLRGTIRMYYPEKKRTVLSGPNVYAATALGMG